MIATKEQERKALAQIKKIVEGLGENSYIATAFEGCFEIAEENIENDFSCSMKDRWLTADRKLNEANGVIEELRYKLAESEKDYEAAHATAHEIAEKKDDEIVALKKMVIFNDDLFDCLAMAADRSAEYAEKVRMAADKIVELADDPGSVEFQDAVKSHRDAKRSKTYMDALKYRLERAADARRQIIAG